MPSAYRGFGKSAKGYPRFQCKACRSTFSTGPSTRRHKKTDKTGLILRGLVNKMPIKRIAEIGEVTYPHIYAKIDYLFEQCLIFAAKREARLCRCFQGKSACFATDAQTLLVNWRVKERRGTVPLRHMATVHRGSQFVVAATVDYDPDVDPDELETRMEEVGDFTKSRPMRENARLWAASEYRSSLLRGLPEFMTQEERSTGGDLALPGTGSRVRGDLFSYAHMMLVRKLIGRAFHHCTFCLDAESGLANATSALAAADITARKVDVVEVSFEKGMVNDMRNQLVTEGKETRKQQKVLMADWIEVVQREIPDATEEEAIIYLNLFYRYGAADRRDRSQDLRANGLSWPFHQKSEPKKRIRIHTDIGDTNYAALASLMTRATIHPVDAYFNHARRRVAGFERGIPPATNKGRIWHAYSYYEPEMVPKVATILRFYYNYMLTGDDRMTPAMRIGLTKGRIYERDLFGVNT